MYSRIRQAVSPVGAVSLVAVVVVIVIGCGNASPFLTARFLTDTQLTTLQSGSFPDSDATDPTADEVLASVCDLPEESPEQWGISVTLENESAQYVQFSMTFVVSAGAGGFVCDDELQDYINAGYSQVGAGNSITIGCDTITLGGSQILTMQFGINQGAAGRLDPYDEETDADFPTLTLRRRDSGGTLIPLPELIIFGNEDSNFICTGGAVLGDLCSQRGFVYSTADDIPVGKSVDASRIQGSICNAGFGSAPEWRLDKTLNTVAQAFQYPVGATIVITILDRSADATSVNRNQVVWLVTDSDDNTVHFPAR
ncbi:MAG: hypothetical protein ABII12_00725 [Planctomycetota bacterium]